MLYLFVALKVPILAACWIIWWAVKQEPDPSEDGGGGPGVRHPRPHSPNPLPHAPRRGPHGDPAPLPPPRVRPVSARARTSLER